RSEVRQDSRQVLAHQRAGHRAAECHWAGFAAGRPMTLVRDRLLNTPHSGIRRMLELTREVADPLLLISGDPNFRTPDHVIFGAAEAASGGATGYPPAEGIAPLRAAIVKKLAQVNRLEAHQDQICVVTGACGGLYTSLMLLVDPGDEVLIPNPGWS